MFELRGRRIWVAGEEGMVGAAIVRRLATEDCEILTAPRATLDLKDAGAVDAWMKRNRPQAVFVAAARVGGIHANSTYPVDFIEDNLAIALNVISAAFRADVEKLLFLGSSCIYPREAPQPMREDALLTGPLEPTNEFYGIAKIAGIKLCQAYRRQYGCDYVSVLPTNLYGPGDNYHPENSHVPAALIRRFHFAREQGAPEAIVWGTGQPRREFMHVNDLADACVFVMQRSVVSDLLNIGTGMDISIAEFAAKVAAVVGFEGRLTFDATRPDGAPRKLLDVSNLTQLGWRARIELSDGLADAYADFRKGNVRAA